MHFPRLSADPEGVFTRDLLRTATAQLLSWRQGAGVFGQLHLHACWGEASSLRRRYHGQTIARYHRILGGAIRLHRNSGDDRWRLLAGDMVGNILYLQTRDGGFYHASSECEPTYTCGESCPIHQGLPVLALLDYAAWPEADTMRVAQIKPAIDAWWRWFEAHWWRRGNAWKSPLPKPGFCGVTNQDLVIVAALARYGEVFGDRTLHVRFGRPVLDAYLENDYYHERIGLFERGDKANFTERSSYYDIILPMLEIVHTATGDERLPRVIDNVAGHLFDALHTGADGLTHMAWGAQTDPSDKTRVLGWQRLPCTFSSYPLFVQLMREHLRRHPDEAREKGCRQLERTLAAYVFADGTIPVALGADPLFAVAGHVNTLWAFLVDRLGEAADVTMDAVDLPVVRRTCGDVAWQTDGRSWTIERGGRREFAGLKCNPFGILIGDETTPAGMALPSFEGAGLEEIVEGFPF